MKEARKEGSWGSKAAGKLGLLSAAYGRAHWALTSLITRIAGIQQGRRQNLGKAQASQLKQRQGKTRRGTEERRGEERVGGGRRVVVALFS